MIEVDPRHEVFVRRVLGNLTVPVDEDCSEAGRQSLVFDRETDQISVAEDPRDHPWIDHK